MHTRLQPDQPERLPASRRRPAARCRSPNRGVNNAPINRIMVDQLYSGTAYPIYQWHDDLQIWSAFPSASSGDAWYDPPYAPH